MTRYILRWIGCTCCFLISSALVAAEPRKIEFNRDIRPILSNNCFVCHGPDNNLRKAKLRLDDEKDAHQKVIVAGKPLGSEFFRRIVSDDPDEKMPPPKAKKHMTKHEIELIRAWIEQGAKYEGHWSLISPRKHELPKIKNAGWVRNDIDRFILARLEAESLLPAPEADRRTLLRRLTFDLLGLPPTPQDVDAFLVDKSPNAYEKVVDRLLASPHFGERLAVHWLDVVRYADTAGYHSDNNRDVYLYRDWVIDAFNKNMPFAQFAVEQIAGDLLPNATNEQKIASGHNRLLQTTEEGGGQAKEYTAKYAADRVRNFSTAWLGLTLGCTECHDHKYDPFTTKEFYKLASFFADIQEVPIGRQQQTPITTRESQEKLKKIDDAIGELQKKIGALPKEKAKEKQQKLAEAQKQKAELVKQIPQTLVTTAMAPRMVRVLKRGNWLDDSGEIVMPDVPGALPNLKIDPSKTKRATRHDLANWLVAAENPLAARVFVNRLWLLYFGQGIVKTADDFGALGAWPSHPELLDWLALDFQASGGDIKRAIKQIVLSEAYRQSSKGTPELRPTRSVQPTPRPPGAFPPRRRVRARQRPGDQRPLRAENWRPQRQAVPARGLLALHEFPNARMGQRQGRKPVSPRPVHPLAAHLPATELARLRRLDTRGMHRRTPAQQHAAASAGAAQRSDLRGGVARLRREDHPVQQDNAGPRAVRLSPSIAAPGQRGGAQNPRESARAASEALHRQCKGCAGLARRRLRAGDEGDRAGGAGGVDVGGAGYNELTRNDHAELIEENMATLNINIPDPMKEFVDREIGSGRFKDASTFVQLLILEAMDTQEEAGFSEEEKEQIDQLLLESMDSFDRGEAVPVRPGEFEELAKRMVEQHQGKQAS